MNFPPNNMKQIKAHIAVSLDGFIATSDNELDWITSNVKSLIGKEYETATCLLMGANTYTYLFEHWGGCYAGLWSGISYRCSTSEST